MKSRAFTLIELMVTIGIIVMLLGIVSVGYSKSRSSMRDAQRVKDINTIANAVEQYAAMNQGKYPGKILNPYSANDILGFTCADRVAEFYSDFQLRKFPDSGKALVNLFPGGNIPLDPKPLVPRPEPEPGNNTPGVANDCSSVHLGYMYYGSHISTNTSRYTGTYNGEIMKIFLRYDIARSFGVNYVLAVALENDKPVDDPSMKSVRDFDKTKVFSGMPDETTMNLFHTLPRSTYLLLGTGK